MTMTADQLARLPKYARQRIAQLARDNESLKQAIAERDGLVDDANTFANDYGGMRGVGERQPLGEGTKITFYLGNDAEGYSERIDAYVRDGWLQLNGGHNLIIVPQSGNTARVQSSRTDH
jgi:hypothetical protein